MKSIEGILKLAENEFEAIVNNGKFRSREEIDSVYKLMDIVKDAHCIWMYEDEESEYSEDGRSYDGSYRGGSYRGGRSYRGSYDGSYDDGMSGARGRGRNARRDSMGRYASRESNYEGGSYRGGRSMNYSRGDGRQEYIEELRSMMEDAPDDQTRQSIQRMIQQMEQG